MKNPTLAKLHEVSPKTLSKFFRQATAVQVNEFTVPCRGEAHSNPFIDNCGLCLGVVWGRMLKSMPSHEG